MEFHWPRLTVPSFSGYIYKKDFARALSLLATGSFFPLPTPHHPLNDRQPTVAMPPIAPPRNRIRTWKDPFALSAKHADFRQEVLAGVLGWMTVVSSVAFCEWTLVHVYMNDG